MFGGVNMDFRSNRKKKGDKSLWQQRGRQTVDDYSQESEKEVAPQQEESKYSFSNLRSKLFGKTAAEVATEQARKLKKRMGR